MANNIPELSNTATDNTSIIGAIVGVSSPMADMNDAVRRMGKMLADFYDDIGGVNTVSGTANAVELTSKMSFASLATGHTCAFKAASTNTGAATIDVDSLGVKAIRLPGDSALLANDILADGTYILRYHSTYDSASGGWELMNRSIPALFDDYEEGSYVPVWTGSSINPDIGNGALAASYVKVGKTVTVSFTLLFGNTTTAGSGAWSFTLPFAASTADISGAMRVRDAGTANYVGVIIGADVNTFNVLTGATASISPAAAGVPATWATGDTINGSFSYIAAT